MRFDFNVNRNQRACGTHALPGWGDDEISYYVKLESVIKYSQQKLSSNEMRGATYKTRGSIYQSAGLQKDIFHSRSAVGYDGVGKNLH